MSLPCKKFFDDSEVEAHKKRSWALVGSPGLHKQRFFYTSSEKRTKFIRRVKQNPIFFFRDMWRFLSFRKHVDSSKCGLYKM